jgi:hypothetical protein
MIIKLKNINVGYKFCQPDTNVRRGRLYEVTDIIRNKNAGEDCKDMWGNKVWETPAYTVKYKDVETGEINCFSVQSENSDLNWIITPCDSIEKSKELAYKCFRKEINNIICQGLSEIFNNPSFKSIDDFKDMIENDPDLNERLVTLLKFQIKPLVTI